MCSIRLQIIRDLSSTKNYSDCCKALILWVVYTHASPLPQSRKPLAAWETAIKQTDFQTFNKLRVLFPSADYVEHRFTIFDISGNKYRLITEIDYTAKVVHIKRVWTHAEYSMKKNEDYLKRRE